MRRIFSSGGCLLTPALPFRREEGSGPQRIDSTRLVSYLTSVVSDIVSLIVSRDIGLDAQNFQRGSAPFPWGEGVVTPNESTAHGRFPIWLPLSPTSYVSPFSMFIVFIVSSYAPFPLGSKPPPNTMLHLSRPIFLPSFVLMPSTVLQLWACMIFSGGIYPTRPLFLGGRSSLPSPNTMLRLPAPTSPFLPSFISILSAVFCTVHSRDQEPTTNDQVAYHAATLFMPILRYASLRDASHSKRVFSFRGQSPLTL